MGALDLGSLPFEGLIAREWLATNGNGSYAASTIAGLNTRKYHGLLVAAMSPPVRRMVILSRVQETVVGKGGKAHDLACCEYPGTISPQGHRCLRAFSQVPFPRWAYQANGFTVEKQLRPLAGENTVLLSYTLLAASEPAEMELRPLFALRPIHELMYQWNAPLEARNVGSSRHHHRLPATSRTPEAFFAHDGKQFAAQAHWYLNTTYRREQERGYAWHEDLWMPGVIRFVLRPGQTVHFACSTEPIDLRRVIAEAERQYDAAVPPAPTPRADRELEALLRAGEQFVVRGTVPAGAPAPGSGTTATTTTAVAAAVAASSAAAPVRERATLVIASYPWSPPLGRDALIAMGGLLLATGRMDDARAMLGTLAGAIEHGLVPSELSEDGSGWKRLAADASLWFVNAVWQYVRYGGDEAFVGTTLLPAVHTIIETYRRGTALGIAVDADGLLRAGAAGAAVTWMDARVGDAAITPRQGYPVSLNALWYNALRVAQSLSERYGQAEHAEELATVAERTREAFNRRFWNAETGCLFDVLGDAGRPNDPAIRPNQLLAISLPNPVLELSLHAMVLETVRKHLLTPVGLRTLAPSHPQYRGSHSAGDASARERALHQGSAYPWLLGPYVTAYLRVHGRSEGARREALALLKGCLEHLQDAGTGQVCELFDGDAPHAPGGAPASARSVGELLRVYCEDVLELTPGTLPGRSRLGTPPPLPGGAGWETGTPGEASAGAADQDLKRTAAT